MKETPWWYRVLWFVGLIVFKSLFRFTVEGEEKIPLRGGAVVAANHRSYLDPIVLALLTPRKINFMAKEELFGNALFGYAIDKLGALPVRREKLDRHTYQRVLRILKRGEIFAFFPEGTRSISGKLGDLKEGPVRIALHSKVPIIPVVIIGTEKILPPGVKIMRWGKIRAKVGNPILPQTSGKKEKEDISRTLQELKKEMITMGANE